MKSASPKAFNKHNHQHCINTALDSAKKICNERGVRLTEIRERALELIWTSHQPLGAYELIALFAKEGRNSAPPTIYRALDFLQEQGLIHRIASLNAFIGCAHPETGHDGNFLICKICGLTQELYSATIQKDIEELALKQNFLIESTTLEVSGLCPNCSEQKS